MLKSLTVWNFALLEHVQIEFDAGLNILTGETGAGKSILIDALGAILGHRISTDAIRTGCDWLRVEAVFTLDGQPALQERLAAVRTELKQTMDELKRINHTNQALLRQSMELLEFDLNLFRSMRQAPETANYNKSAVNTGDLLGSRGFDAKQ